MMAYRKIQGIKFQKQKEESNGHVDFYCEGNEMLDTYVYKGRQDRIYQTHQDSYTKFRNDKCQNTESTCIVTTGTTCIRGSGAPVVGRDRPNTTKAGVNTQRNNHKPVKVSSSEERTSKLDRLKKYLTVTLKKPLIRLNNRRAVSECEGVYWLV